LTRTNLVSVSLAEETQQGEFTQVKGRYVVKQPVKEEPVPEVKPVPVKQPSAVKIFWKSRMKTSLCVYFNTKTGCKNANSCKFAHGDTQLALGPIKTKLCFFF